MTKEFEARIEKLEEHVAHQEQVIDELNQTITNQWAEIEKLTRRLNAAVLRLQAVEERPQGPATAEPPPPHY
jgi:SlyX protein